MELYIETLTGAAFELRVSPFETVMSVKAKIQRLEGIPIAQQHLIWKSMELEDDYCLHDYSIHDGATLKLVLAMRGGPINTRRIPMEDPAMREVAELMEANREDMWDKPAGRQVTLVVFREGNQLNFFKVVDRGDGTLTPLSETLSGASMYNFNDEDEDEEAPTREKLEENEQLKEKMKNVRLKMEKLNISKKPRRKPHPPSSGRAGSSRASRLRHIPSTSYSLGPALNRNVCLPPVGHSLGHAHSLALHHSLLKERIERLDRDGGKERAAAAFDASLAALQSSVGEGPAAGDEGPTDTPSIEELLNLHTPSPKRQLDSLEKLSQALTSVIEDDSEKISVETSNPVVHSEQPIETNSSNNQGGESPSLSDKPIPGVTDRANTDIKIPDPLTGKSISEKVISETEPSSNCDNNSISVAAPDRARDLLSYSGLPGEPGLGPRSASKVKDLTLENLRESLRPPPSSKTKSKMKGDLSLLESLRETLGQSSSLPRHSSIEKRKEFTLESLNPSEARAMSGLLRQASLEKVGSSRIGNVTVTSASRNRVTGNVVLGDTTFQQSSRLTPEGRLMSARLQRMASSRDGRILSPSHRLPPVKAKKKATKRCFVCTKKTGLACSYTCRCGHNFCASHRYAESHDCTFDYKTEGRKLLEHNNPVVSAPKLPKI